MMIKKQNIGTIAHIPNPPNINNDSENVAKRSVRYWEDLDNITTDLINAYWSNNDIKLNYAILKLKTLKGDYIPKR